MGLVKATVPEWANEQMMKKIKKLNYRASKINMPLGFPKLVNEFFDTDSDGLTQKYYVYEMPEIPAPKINGWQFIARLQPTDSGTIINVVPSYNEPIPQKYYHTDCHCDHCRINRYRTDLFLLKNDNNEYKQVGKSCLEQFLSTRSVSDILGWFNLVELYQGEMSDVPEGDQETRRGQSYLSIKEYLPYVACSIRKNGFVSSSDVELGKTPTSKDAYWMQVNKDPITQEDIDMAMNALEFAREYFANNARVNEYENNLKVLTKEDYFPQRNKGYVASLIPYYQRKMNSITKNDYSNSNFVGAIGDKLCFTGKLVFEKVCDTDYGVSTLLKFQDERGNVFSWFASGYKLGNYTKDETLTIKGRVKDHETYGGVKQTILTRCSIN